MKELFFRLEYNEKQGGFHCEMWRKKQMMPANTFGWVTICDYISDSMQRQFTNLMMDKYRALNWSLENRRSYKTPTAKKIRAEFEKFMGIDFEAI